MQNEDCKEAHQPHTRKSEHRHTEAQQRTHSSATKREVPISEQVDWQTLCTPHGCFIEADARHRLPRSIPTRVRRIVDLSIAAVQDELFPTAWHR